MRTFITSLLEFFCLRETEDEDDRKAGYANPFDKPAPMKAVGSKPMGGMMSPKPKMTGPGQKQPPQKKVDPGTEFLRKHGYLQKGGSRLSQEFEPPPPTASRTDKPKIKGSFIGQSQTTAGPYKSRSTSWTEREPGSKNPVIDPKTGLPMRRYGAVQSQQKVTWVWNGSDWVTDQEFNAQFGAGKK